MKKIALTLFAALLPICLFAQTENPRGVYKLVYQTDRTGKKVNVSADLYKICTDSLILQISINGDSVDISDPYLEVLNYTGEAADTSNANATRVFDSNSKHFTRKWWSNYKKHLLYPQNAWCTEYYVSDTCSTTGKIVLDALMNPAPKTDKKRPLYGNWHYVGIYSNLKQAKDDLKAHRYNIVGTYTGKDIVCITDEHYFDGNGVVSGMHTDWKTFVDIGKCENGGRLNVHWLSKNHIAIETRRGEKPCYVVRQRITDDISPLSRIASNIVMRRKEPMRSGIRIGCLANGMQYIIADCGNSEQTSSFYLIQRTGSLQEEPDERGLAHFLEHMAFNGSEHFEYGEVIAFCERHGVGFGQFNAHTCGNYTSYEIPYMKGDEHVMDTCLMIMHDFAHGLTLNDDRIEQEREIITQEYYEVTAANVFQKILNNNFATLWNNSRYGINSDAIGNLNVIKNFKPKNLRNFYKRWYQPANQMLFLLKGCESEQKVSEELDIWEMKIRDSFSDLKNNHYKEIVEYNIQDNTEPIIVVDKDTAIKQDILFMYQKCNITPYSESSSYQSYSKQLGIAKYAIALLNNRLGNENYYIGGMSELSNSTRQTVIKVMAFCSDSLMSNLITCLRQAAEYGFSEEEMEDNRPAHVVKYISSFDQQEAIRYFIYDNPADFYMIDGFSYYEITSADLQNWIRQTFFSDISNKSILCACSEKPDRTYPDKSSILNAIDKGMKTPVTEYKYIRTEVDDEYDADDEDDLEKDRFIEPQSVGSIVSERVISVPISTEEDQDSTIVEMLLSNGAKVYLHIDGKNGDACKISAIGDGGARLCTHGDAPGLKLRNSIEEDAEDIDHTFGKLYGSFRIYPNYSFYDVSEGKRKERLFKKLYTDFVTGYGTDSTFITNKKFKEIALKYSQQHTPSTDYEDSISYCLYGSSALLQTRPTEKEIMSYDLKQWNETLSKQFADASRYTFFIEIQATMDYMLNEFPPDTTGIRELICKYIASLPCKHSTDIIPKLPIVTIEDKDVVMTYNSDNPQTRYAATWITDKLPLTIENTCMTSILAKMTEIIMVKKIRQELGAIYSPFVDCVTDYDSDDNAIYGIKVVVNVDPTKEHLARSIVDNVLSDISHDCNTDILMRSKNNTRNMEFYPFCDVKSLTALLNKGYGANWDSFEQRERQEKTFMDKITPEMIQNFVSQFLKTCHKGTVTMKPR